MSWNEIPCSMVQMELLARMELPRIANFKTYQKIKKEN